MNSPPVGDPPAKWLGECWYGENLCDRPCYLKKFIVPVGSAKCDFELRVLFWMHYFQSANGRAKLM